MVIFCQKCVKPLKEVLSSFKYIRKYPYHEKNNTKCEDGCKCKSLTLYWCTSCSIHAPNNASFVPESESDSENDDQ